MKCFAVIAVVLLASPVWAQAANPTSATPTVAAPATSMTPPPGDRAKQWLGLVDDQNYNDAYKQMSATAQGGAAAGPWAQKLGATRAPLGAMASRYLKSISMTRTLPAMHAGQYAVVKFDSSFAHQAGVVETVTLSSEKDGWSVISYAIN